MNRRTFFKAMLGLFALPLGRSPAADGRGDVERPIVPGDQEIKFEAVGSEETMSDE